MLWGCGYTEDGVVPCGGSVGGVKGGGGGRGRFLFTMLAMDFKTKCLISFHDMSPVTYQIFFFCFLLHWNVHSSFH